MHMLQLSEKKRKEEEEAERREDRKYASVSRTTEAPKPQNRPPTKTGTRTLLKRGN